MINLVFTKEFSVNLVFTKEFSVPKKNDVVVRLPKEAISAT